MFLFIVFSGKRQMECKSDFVSSSKFPFCSKWKVIRAQRIIQFHFHRPVSMEPPYCSGGQINENTLLPYLPLTKYIVL